MLEILQALMKKFTRKDCARKVERKAERKNAGIPSVNASVQIMLKQSLKNTRSSLAS